jgi:O-antigen ligase
LSVSEAPPKSRPELRSKIHAASARSDDQEGDHVLYAHGLPLELWAELGIAGAVAALALYAAAVAALVRARRSTALWLAGVGVAAFLLSNLVDFPWHLAGAGAVWALGLGVVIAAGRAAAPPGASSRSHPLDRT